MPARPHAWRFSVGARGERVTAYEKEPGGLLYARVWLPELGRFRKQSLGHRDRDRAQDWAVAEARRLKTGCGELTAERPTLGRILNLYLTQHTPTKSATEQRYDGRRVEMFTAYFGARLDPLRLDEAHRWEAFIAARRSGAIDARGQTVAPDKRRPNVRGRAIEQDCTWLVWVLAWAARRKVDGRPLLDRAPSLKALRESVSTWPEVRNERRPYVSRERYEALRAAASKVTLRTTGRPTYLLELLDLAFHTGRRISQLCRLVYADYLPTYADPRTGQRAPYGAIRWRAETDKQRRERIAPLNREAQATVVRVLRDRPGLGDAPMFPSPHEPGRAISRHLADDWLRRAEKVAGLEPLGGAWHAFRRSWATSRKHLSPVDVAAAGGWASPLTLQQCYQQVDLDTMLLVVTNPAELREAKRG